MKRACGQVLAGLFVAGVGGTISSACTHNDTTIFIRDVLAPTIVAAGQACSYTSDPAQPFIASGTLDIDFRHSYEAEFLVGNQLVPQGNPSTPTTETSYFKIEGAVVRITDVNGVQINSFTTLAGTTIPPSVGTTPGYAPIGYITIVDNATIEAPAFLSAIQNGAVGRLVTYTHFFGHTIGGQYEESSELEFPVDVCRACLIDFTASDISPSAPAPNCLGNGTSATTTTAVPCVIGQDDHVDCMACQAYPDCHGTLAGKSSAVVDAGSD